MNNRNLLLSSLPYFKAPDDFIKAISLFPPHPDHVRQYENCIRGTDYTIAIQDWFYFGSDQFTIASKIQNMIREGYIKRFPPGSPQHTGIQYECNDDKVSSTSKPILKDGESIVAVVEGLTGFGKTKTVRSILSMFPQTVDHKNYPGFKGLKPQIVWFSMTVRSASEKDFAIELATAWNDLFAVKYPDMAPPIPEAGLDKRSAGVIIRQFLRSAATYDLGLIHLDEINSLFKVNSSKASLANGSTVVTPKEENTLNRILGILNKGIPVLMTCTPNGTLGLCKSSAIERRIGSNKIVMPAYRPKKTLEPFLEKLWEFQYTDQSISLTPELIDLVYEKTFGVPGMIVDAFIKTQQLALLLGKPKIEYIHFQHVFNNLSDDLKRTIIAYHNHDLNYLSTKTDSYL